MSSAIIIPEWPAPNNIKAFSSTRIGGVSPPPYDALNLSDDVGDDPDLVNKNRCRIAKFTALPEYPRWLKQMHGTNVINSSDWHKKCKADAIISRQANHVCAIMTADCLPILLCDRYDNTIAAIHAGWRGLAAGILEKAAAEFISKRQDIIAWLGPAIGPSQFEVGTDTYKVFYQHSSKASLAFQATSANSYLANIYLLAKQRLHSVGITAIFGGSFCTATDSQRFFSYRRNSKTGRMATMIWHEDR